MNGDNNASQIAQTIFVQCGILLDGDVVIEGREFCNYLNNETKQHWHIISILARSFPSNKLLMMTTWKEMGEVFFVIGDGTNDTSTTRDLNVSLSMVIQGTKGEFIHQCTIVIMDGYLY